MWTKLIVFVFKLLFSLNISDFSSFFQVKILTPLQKLPPLSQQTPSRNWDARTSNNINIVHERALKVVLNDHTSDFKTFLQRNNDVCNHHRSIQALLIETCKRKSGFALPIIGSMFKRRNTTYSLKFWRVETKRKKICLIRICIVYLGVETLSYRSPQLWGRLTHLTQFIWSERQWVCNTSPFRLCKVYLQNVVFL